MQSYLRRCALAISKIINDGSGARYNFKTQEAALEPWDTSVEGTGRVSLRLYRKELANAQATKAGKPTQF
jgi:hypothetical protein